MSKSTMLRRLEQEWLATVASGPRERLVPPDWLKPVPGYGPMQGLVPLRPAALFAELEDVRRVWLELREWPLLRKHAESMVNPGWTYKDLLAHLASWAEEFYREAAGAAEGVVFDYEIPFEPGIGPTEWNEREVARRLSLSLDEIFDQYDAAVGRVQDLVIKTPPEQFYRETRFPIRMGPQPLVGNIPRIAQMKTMHDHYHFTQIRARLAALQAQEGGPELTNQ